MAILKGHFGGTSVEAEDREAAMRATGCRGSAPPSEAVSTAGRAAAGSVAAPEADGGRAGCGGGGEAVVAADDGATWAGGAAAAAAAAAGGAAGPAVPAARPALLAAAARVPRRLVELGSHSGSSSLAGGALGCAGRTLGAGGRIGCAGLGAGGAIGGACRTVRFGKMCRCVMVVNGLLQDGHVRGEFSTSLGPCSMQKRCPCAQSS